MADTSTTLGDRTLDAAPIYAAVADRISNYLAAARARDVVALERMLWPLWRRKHILSNDDVRVETRAAFLERIRCDGAGAGGAHLSNVQGCFTDFAIARLDDWEHAASTFLLLFKEHDAWRITGEACANATAGARAPQFRARDTEREVLDVLEDYYRAVTEGDPAAIRCIFAPCWSMTNHENDNIVSEDTDAFAKRLEEGPLPTYWDDRRIADVQIVAGRLAYVRVDKPSTPSTTVFMFARLGDAWKVIDKAWADGRK